MPTPKVLTPALFEEWLRACNREDRIISEHVRIAPDMAEILLQDRNLANRNTSGTKLDHYAEDMRGQRFQMNGEPLIFAKTGEINDGQHRLSSCVNSGVPFETMITIGVERDSRYTVDIGVVRTAGAFIKMRAEAEGGKRQYSNETAAIARWVLAYERAGGRDLNSRAISTSAVLDRVNSDPMVEEAIRFAVTFNNKRPPWITRSLLGFAYYLLVPNGGKEASDFLSGLITRENIQEDDIRHEIARKCEAIYIRPHTKQRILEVILRGWNLTTLGRQKQKLQLSKNEAPYLPELIFPTREAA